MAAASAPPAAELNVRELLELERQLYQDSIERVRKQHEELLRGSLEDFVQRCAPFEAEKGYETQAAMVQLQLNKRNGLDLLEFELKQADDVYKAQCEELKQHLLVAARNELARLERHATALGAGVAQSGHRKRKRVQQQRNSIPTTPRCEPLSSRDALAHELTQCMASNARAFNLQHLTDVLPTGASVAAAVADECARQQRVHEQFALAAPDAVKVHADVSAQTLTIDVSSGSDSSPTTFCVGDFVVLASQLSDEEFYGQVIGISDAAVQLVLVCGTSAHAMLAALRSGRCALTHQRAPPTGMPIDERAVVDTKQLRLESMRKRKGRRRRAVDVRRGF